jgi:hypothetical protein
MEDYNTNIHKCISTDFYDHYANIYKNDSYKTAKFSQNVRIHTNSMLLKFQPEYFIYQELVMNIHQYMHNITVIDSWVVDLGCLY